MNINDQVRQDIFKMLQRIVDAQGDTGVYSPGSKAMQWGGRKRKMSRSMSHGGSKKRAMSRGRSKKRVGRPKKSYGGMRLGGKRRKMSRKSLSMGGRKRSRKNSYGGLRIGGKKQKRSRGGLSVGGKRKGGKNPWIAFVAKVRAMPKYRGYSQPDIVKIASKMYKS